MEILEALRWFTSLGVGGVLAGAIFYFYRNDFLKERERAAVREDRFLTVLERNAVALEKSAASTERLALAAERTLARDAER